MARSYEMQFKLGAQLAKNFRTVMSGAQGILGGVTKELQGVSRAAADINGIIKQRDAVKRASEAHEAARAKLHALSEEARKAQRPNAELNRELKKAQTEVNKTSAALERQNAQLARMHSAAGLAGTSTRELERRQRALASQAERTRAAQQRLSASMAARDANLAQRGNLRGQMMGTAMMAMAAAAPVKVAADFQQQLATVGAKGGFGAEDMKALREQARELGATTVWSASEAAQGMEFLAMAGFQASEVMASMPGLLDLASAAGTDLGRTADIASDILSGFGIEASEMGRVADVLANTATTSNTNLEMLGDTMKYVGPVARAAGMSLEETSAMAGLLANVGIKSSQAGTAMKSMLLRLANPSTKASQVLADLGVEIADSEGNMRNMVEVMADMAKATENMGSQERLAAIAEVFGREPAAGMAELIEKGGAGEIAKYVEVMMGSEGKAAQIAADMNNTFYGSLKQLKSATEDLFITVGDTLIPTLTEIGGILTNLASKIGEWTKENPELTQTIVKVTAGLVAFKVATLALAYGWTFLKGIFLTAKVAINAVRSATLLFNTALLANPITWVVAGIVALIAVGYLLWRNWDEVKAWLLATWDTIREATSNAWTAIKDGVVGAVQAVWDYLMSFSLFESGVAIFTTLIDGLKSMGGALVDTVKGAFSKVRDFLPFSDAKVGPFAQLTESGASIMRTLGEGMESVGEAPLLAPFKAAADKLINAPANALGAIGGAFGGGGGGEVTLNLTQNITVAGADAAGDARAGASAGAADLLEAVRKALREEQRRGFE